MCTHTTFYIQFPGSRWLPMTYSRSPLRVYGPKLKNLFLEEIYSCPRVNPIFLFIEKFVLESSPYQKLPPHHRECMTCILLFFLIFFFFLFSLLIFSLPLFPYPFPVFSLFPPLGQGLLVAPGYKVTTLKGWLLNPRIWFKLTYKLNKDPLIPFALVGQSQNVTHTL